MASIMSLQRTLLYLLSLSSLSLASNQDILEDSDRDTSSLNSLSSHDSLVLVTKTVTYDEHPWPTQVVELPSAPTYLNNDSPTFSCPPAQKECNNSCIPTTQDCCSAAEHCFPGDYCYHHQGSVRCCPEGLACFQISGDVCFEQRVL
ncbi:uncharacterized protein BDV17DRAFT_272387 [Aspergillus undulatus]|uniref:uncharacterized protein n=1 Tax=Aspergillus undulatus TaxID=1810928 RepID=UPI003CCCFF51